MKAKNLFGVIFAVSFCALLGTCMKPAGSEKPSPTATVAQPTIAPTFTATMCDRTTWTQNTIEVLSMLPDAITIDLVDALITKYDHIKAPYSCGHTELVDQIDTEVRLALGAKRTAHMTTGDKSVAHDAESEIHTIAATKAMVEYTAKP